MNNPFPSPSAKAVNILHADHGLSEPHLAIVNSIAVEASGFFLTVVELPKDCPDLMCALYGPTCGDEPVPESEVEYVKRAGRNGPSRLVDRPQRPCRRMVVCGMGGANEALVFTAYGTLAEKATPREWWDQTMTPAEAVEAATHWTEHALSSQ